MPPELNRENHFFGAVVMVIGACGSVGQELVRQLIAMPGLKQLICLDNNESELFFLEHRYRESGPITCYLADIRESRALLERMDGVDILFNVAAYKHVTLCERSPLEAVHTNVLGVHNVIQAVQKHRVPYGIFASSDKAVNPTNVMGASKLMGERLVTAADLLAANSAIASVRFGNVVGSRGSVFPIFLEQISRGGPVTLTHPAMTRFIMHIADAVSLLINTVGLAKGGEVFVTKMPALCILDLAQVMIATLAPVFGRDPESIAIQEIGARPGEKIFEELMNSEETRRSRELANHFVILPPFREESPPPYLDEISDKVIQPYNSSDSRLMNKEEILAFLAHSDLQQMVAEAAANPPGALPARWYGRSSR